MRVRLISAWWIAAGVALILASMSGCKTQPADNEASKPLFVFNWTNYIGQTTISDFERESGAEVIYDMYASNEELIQQLRVSTRRYDVVFPSDAIVQDLVDAKQLVKLKMELLPNLKFVDERFRGLPYDPQNSHCIPYLWGTTGIAVNTQRYTKPFVGWEILWDADLKGKISLLNEPRDGLLPALKLLGYSINSQNPDEVRQAKELTIKQKHLVKAYTSDDYLNMLETGDVWVAVAYSGDVVKASANRPHIKFVIPEQGTTLFVDNVCISRAGRNPALAHRFINYLMNPKVAATITNDTGFATVNAEARQYIKKEVSSNRGVYPADEVLGKLEYAKTLGDSLELYEDAWDEVIRAKAEAPTAE